MKVELTKGGTFVVNKGTTKVEIFRGLDRPHKPVSIAIDGGVPIPIKKEVGLVEINRKIKELYTEEELLDYLISLY